MLFCAGRVRLRERASKHRCKVEAANVLPFNTSRQACVRHVHGRTCRARRSYAGQSRGACHTFFGVKRRVSRSRGGGLRRYGVRFFLLRRLRRPSFFLLSSTQLRRVSSFFHTTCFPSSPPPAAVSSSFFLLRRPPPTFPRSLHTTAVGAPIGRQYVYNLESWHA